MGSISTTNARGSSKQVPIWCWVWETNTSWGWERESELVQNYIGKPALKVCICIIFLLFNGTIRTLFDAKHYLAMDLRNIIKIGYKILKWSLMVSDYKSIFLTWSHHVADICLHLHVYLWIFILSIAFCGYHNNNLIREQWMCCDISWPLAYWLLSPEHWFHYYCLI